MAIKTKPTYTEDEVSKILKESEGVGAGDRGAGHSEGLHELQAVGRKREHTTMSAIEERIVGDERKTRSGAFDGCQAKAIAHALNTKGGQTALGFLCMDSVEFVFVKLDIRSGSFRAVNMSVDETTKAPSGADFVVAPSGVTLTGFLAPQVGCAGGVAMKLMKTPQKNLHIRTAFPLADAPSPPTAQIRYTGKGGIQNQDLPV